MGIPNSVLPNICCEPLAQAIGFILGLMSLAQRRISLW